MAHHNRQRPVKWCTIIIQRTIEWCTIIYSDTMKWCARPRRCPLLPRGGRVARVVASLHRDPRVRRIDAWVLTFWVVRAGDMRWRRI